MSEQTWVFIAEKPSLAKEIALAIDPGARKADGHYVAGPHRVAYCVGHMVEGLKPDEYDPALIRWSLDTLPFIPPDWRFRPKAKKDASGRDVKKNGKVVLDEGIVAQINVIKRLVAGSTLVVHAGDPDREGQLIVDQLLAFVGGTGSRQVKRLWLNELNAPGIRKAVSRMKPNADYLQLSLSAKARSEADYLIGLNCTRGYTQLWQRAGNDGMLHVGRVQTPTLWLVRQRELEREQFKAVDHFGVKVRVAHAKGEFDATWAPAVGSSYLDEEGRVISRQAAQRVLDAVTGALGEVESTQTEPKTMRQPLPYTLLDLQKAANKQYGLRPKETLDIAQKLYEVHKVLSYPRTDSPYLPEEDFGNAPDVVAAMRANYAGAWVFPGMPDFSIKSPAWNDKKLGAHFGIIPTVGRKAVVELSPREKQIYGLVCRRYLAQFYPVHQYETTVVVLRSVNEQFKATGRVVLVHGWRELYASPLGADRGPEVELPKVARGDAVHHPEASLVVKRTEAPPLLDGATLLEAMKSVHRYVTDPDVKSKLKEVEGLGTEATRAGHIEHLVANGYVAEVAKKGGKDSGVEYVTTEHGRALLGVVQTALSKPDLTAWFESKLEDILEGALAFERFRQMLERYIYKVVDTMKSPEAMEQVPRIVDPTAKICPKCGSTMKVRLARESKDRFWGCVAYPACKSTEPYAERAASRGSRAAVSGNGVARSAPARSGLKGLPRGCAAARKHK